MSVPSPQQLILNVPQNLAGNIPGKFFEAQAQFGIYLLKMLMADQQQSNSSSSIVLSPISLSSVLSQLHLGAAGQTAVELGKIFGDGIFLFKIFFRKLYKLLLF